MGHTVLSQRKAVDLLLQELHEYGRSLRPEERQLLEQLLREPLKHTGSITFASSIHTWAFLLLSIAIEQQKTIRALNDRLLDTQQPRRALDETRTGPGEQQLEYLHRGE